MKRYLIILSGILFSLNLAAQSNFTGQVLAEDGSQVLYATVALLKPSDSTMAAFGITGEKGYFEIKRVQQGSFIVQVACMGFSTMYKPVSFPQNAGNFGIVVLKHKTIQLGAAEVTADHIPLIVKKDTLEYNAAAFKTKPDAVAEDLLRKLPGVEVDRAGNIKAMGEDVKNVMVDGKEFFSSDPKVATKNLPADAISKVQVYDKKSEASELAGVDDGSRDKTINLLLKDGKKQAWIGEVRAGAGTEEKYSVSGKAYRFTRKDQFAVLGMLNNVNQFGFSFQDYIDFNGGLPSLMSGGSVKLTITSDEELPVNFGQNINGLVNSAAGGLNYSYDIRRNSRVFASYLGSGTNRTQNQSASTRNYLPGSEFTQNESSAEKNSGISHRFNLGWKNKSDSTRTLLFNSNVALTGGNGKSGIHTETFRNLESVSSLQSDIAEKKSYVSGNANFSYLKRGNNRIRLYSGNATLSMKKSLSENDRMNLLQYAGMDLTDLDDQYRDIDQGGYRFSASVATLIRISKGLFLEPEAGVNFLSDRFSRNQGFNHEGEARTDSLSPDFTRTSLQLLPGIKARWIQGKHKLVPGIRWQAASTTGQLNGDAKNKGDYFRWLPFVSWEYEPRTSNRFNVDFSSSVNEPPVDMLVPVADNSNPQVLFFGNRELKPETQHEISAGWFLYDQFSRTSVFARIGGRYITDRLGYQREVSDSLVQRLHASNTGDAANYFANIDFGTPIHLVGVNFHLALDANRDQGSATINGIRNTTISQAEGIRLSVDRLKKEKWDLDLGVEFGFNKAKYSVMSGLNNTYTTLNYYSDFSVTPNDTWAVSLKADIRNYGAGDYGSAVTIPLISLEVSCNFLKNKRAGLILEGYDLLDKNKGFERINEMNYSREVRTDNIGRYFLLSFRYRLNKATAQGSGLEIKMKRR